MDVVVTSPTTFTIVCNRASLSLFYDFSSIATMLPRQIWDQPWPDDLAVQTYNPTQAYQVAPGYAAGPNPPPTNLFGTGPWIFQFYNPVNMEADLWANNNYFLNQVNVQTLMTQMFWEVGDQNTNGHIDVTDLTNVSLKFGLLNTDPGYDPTCDFNSDGIVDMRDFARVSWHLDWSKVYSG